MTTEYAITKPLFTGYVKRGSLYYTYLNFFTTELISSEVLTFL